MSLSRRLITLLATSIVLFIGSATAARPIEPFKVEEYTTVYYRQYASDHLSDVRRKADKGDSEAQYEMGARSVSTNMAQAVEWIRKAALQGHAEAQFEMSMVYQNGYGGVEADTAEAMKWLALASENGNAKAQLSYAAALMNNSDETRGVEMMQKSAEADYPPAQYCLGQIYENGIGVDRDMVNAARWYRRAALNGDIDAICKMGFIRLSADSQALQQEAPRWWKTGADLGNSECMVYLGLWYNDSSSRDFDPQEAVTWYRKAIDTDNNVTATHYLALAYLNGTGVTKDTAEGVRLLNDAAERDYADAQNLLGIIYYTGHEFIPVDAAKAVQWWRRSADNGNSSAINNVGSCYYQGTGVDVDYSEAFKWFKRAAESGDPYGISNMGECYEMGRGTAPDPIKAKDCYLRAIELDVPGAFARLGAAYCTGSAVAGKKDAALAFKYLTRCIELYEMSGINDDFDRELMANSCHLLSGLHRFGRGCPENTAEANRLASLAAQYGNPDAVQVNAIVTHRATLRTHSSPQRSRLTPVNAAKIR